VVRGEDEKELSWGRKQLVTTATAKHVAEKSLEEHRTATIAENQNRNWVTMGFRLLITRNA